MNHPGKRNNPDNDHKRVKVSFLRRLRRNWDRYRWLVIGCAWLGALFLGYIGFSRYAVLMGESSTPWDRIYLTLQLIPLNSGALPGSVGWELNVARLLIPLLTALTAVEAFALLFQQQFDQVRLRFLRNHIVICGLSHKGYLLTCGFRENGYRVVVIEKDPSNNLLEQCRILGAIVLVGDATDHDVLRKASTPQAKVVLAVCDNDNVNAEIAVSVKETIFARVGTPLTCIIHIVDPLIYSLLREREIEMEAGSAFRLELFNIYDRGAQLLLRDLSAFNTAQERTELYLVVIGLGMMGESLVVHAARVWRKNHNQPGNPTPTLHITVVDREANRKVKSLNIRHPSLKEYCSLTAYELDVNNSEFQSGNFLPESKSLAGVDLFCICLDDDSLSLFTGLSLLRLTRKFDKNIIFRVSEISGLTRLLESDDGAKSIFGNLRPFALLDRTCTPDVILGGTHEILAQAIHEEYLRRQRLVEKGVGKGLLEGNSLVPWESLPERLKEMNRQQVDNIWTKLRSVRCGIAPLTDWEAASFEFRPEEIEQMAKMEHEGWVKQHQLDGWIFTAGAKNPDRKTHPDLVPWEVLPEPEKEKNRNTVREIPRFLAWAGFQVERHKE